MNVASRHRQLMPVAISCNALETSLKKNCLWALPSGEYRSRTDDLLRAKQAL